MGASFRQRGTFYPSFFGSAQRPEHYCEVQNAAQLKKGACMDQNILLCWPLPPVNPCADVVAGIGIRRETPITTTLWIAHGKLK